MKTFAAAVLMEKLARHLALLACLAIVFKASGWSDPGQFAIWLLAVLAAALHLCGRTVAHRRREHPSR